MFCMNFRLTYIHIYALIFLFVTLVFFNPLNAELNPICHLLALLGNHHISHVSEFRVNILKDYFEYPAYCTIHCAISWIFKIIFNIARYNNEKS